MRLTAEAAPDGALVRRAVGGDRWAEAIPPVPAGFDVSVSFSCEESADLHGEALALLGYRVVPEPVPYAAPSAGGGAGPHADFLVPRRLLRAHPVWWRALLDPADCAYDLAFGPVAAVLQPVVSAHRRA